MKWTTKTEYIDGETGEVLSKKHITSGKYIIIKTEKTKTQKYGDNYQKNFRYTCRRNNQIELELETTARTNQNR